jgi:ABC-2 type transport system ATP-binding protein
LINEIIFQVRGLSKSLNGSPVISELDMEVSRGDICVLIGPNNSGKTMFLRIISTLVKPDAGRIEVFGKSFTNNKKDILKNMGFLIDAPVFYNHLTLFDNIALYSRYIGVEKDNDEINRLFKSLGLLDLSTTKVKYLTKGERKLGGIARALYNSPPIVFLDEPFESLDIKNIKIVKELIKSLNEEKGITFIIASKQLVELEDLFTRMVLIDKGRFIAGGIAQEILEESMVSLIIKTNDNKKAYELLSDSDLSIDKIFKEDDYIKLNCEKGSSHLVNKLLNESGFEVYTIQPEGVLKNYYLTFSE